MPFRPLVLAALALVLTASPAVAQTVTANPPAGPVVGTVGSVMLSFRGIPYGEAPIGALRWAPPVARAPWTTPLDAAAFGNRCPQNDSPFGDPSVNEDCLVLNVYVPHRKAVPERDLRKKRPVMVWIHGGAFISGSAESYDPSKLVDRGDVVVVTINYRLGSLGFLAHPALSAQSPDGVSGNYGILDQQLALRWVRDNIAAFGGNPRRVTIFGESAGGISVHSQLASPGAAGLFHRAIAQSGAVFVQPTLAEAEASGTAKADELGCSDQTAECLRALSVAEVLAAQPTGLRTAQPVIDGVVHPLPFRAAFENGEFNRVPIIEGSNHDEMRLFVALLFDLQGGPLTEAGYPAAVSALLGVPLGVAPLLTARYPVSDYASPALALGALATDAGFSCNARTASLAFSPYVPTYAYEFADQDAPTLYLPPVSFPYGAAHAFELQYLFDLAGPVPPEPFDAGQQQLSDTMIRYWTRFAKSGKPTAPRSPRWPRFDMSASGSAQMLSLVPPQPVLLNQSVFSFDHQCGFWDPLLD